jgi:hypothetical protein
MTVNLQVITRNKPCRVLHSHSEDRRIVSIFMIMMSRAGCGLLLNPPRPMLLRGFPALRFVLVLSVGRSAGGAETSVGQSAGGAEISSCGAAGGGCGSRGTCVGGTCVCTGGFSGAQCATPPDPCRYPAAVHCGATARCLNGTCVRRNPCEGVDCGAHGRCGRAGVCECDEGFRGSNCIDVDTCHSGPCLNGGTCYQGTDVRADGPAHEQLGAAWAGRYVCACAGGYEGAHCECLGCSPHGACHPDEAAPPGQGGGRCHCEAGWSGERCDVDIDECASSPCQGGSTCEDGVAAYGCVCAVGWEGDNCATNPDDCASSPCLHGGMCSDGASAYSCECTAGYAGNDCAEALTACSSRPCLHGGSCA